MTPKTPKTAKTAKPEPKIIDPFDVLTVAELRHGAKVVGADLQHAVANRTEHRADALAVTAWLLERRSNINADLGGYREMTLADVYVECAVLAGTPRELFADDLSDDDADEALATLTEAPEAPAAPGEEPTESPTPPTS